MKWSTSQILPVYLIFPLNIDVDLDQGAFIEEKIKQKKMNKMLLVFIFKHFAPVGHFIVHKFLTS